MFEENKNLITLTLDHLIGLLMEYEERLSPPSNVGSMEEKSFASREGKTSTSVQGGAQGRRRWRRRGGFQGIGDSPRGEKIDKQCYYCNKYGKYERECRLKASQEEAQSANYGDEDTSSTLFLSYAHLAQK